MTVTAITKEDWLKLPDWIELPCCPSKDHGLVGAFIIVEFSVNDWAPVLVVRRESNGYEFVRCHSMSEFKTYIKTVAYSLYELGMQLDMHSLVSRYEYRGAADALMTLYREI